ncbi:thioredoxin family protein [Halobacillus halophilus]|uniref:thioredoxin family protein n=1 Tax=Halobacillus halophilus TaxID=1570 RepID=UPI001370AE37|nr:thioredoxin family protein [Halobacillus halophilus]MYL31313.1 thioredoxin family protein [Halobacillus halophilus]
MDLDQQFHEGMHPQEYVDQMQSHQNDLLYIYENFSTQVEDVPLFEEVQNNQWRALVLTEDWCGDAMLNLPIFLRIAEAAQIDTRFFLRDENPGLMDHYLTNGTSRSIPKIILIDSAGNEAAVWGPRAPELEQFVSEALTSLPGKEAPDHEEKRREVLLFVTKAFRDNQDFWHYVYEDLKQTLKF